MTIADLLGAVRVSEPQLSPDGKLVAYVRTTTDVTSGKRNADIWVVPADRSAPPKLLVGGEKSENTPRWSPDGKAIAFLSNRDGETQVYIADASGGNVRQVTKIASGVQPPLVFSPDSSMVAFVSDVKMADEPANVHVLTRLLFRHWDEWRENVRHHVFIAPVAGGDPKDLTPGDYDSPPTQQEDGAITFTPDGRELIFVSNREGNDKEAYTTNNDVWSVPVSGGDAKKLTANPASDLQPQFTPDGKYMIVRAQRRPQFESDRFYLDVYDRATGAKRTVFETPDLSVSDFIVSRDGTTVFFTATSKGTDNLYSVPLSGGAPVEREPGGAIGSFTSGGTRLAYTRSAFTAPADVWVTDTEGVSRNKTQLTHENDAWLKDVAFDTPQSLTVPGAGGTPVQLLADQAAELRSLEEISRGLPDSRRPPGGLGRRLVVPLEPVAVGGSGLGRRRAEPARLDRLRAEVRRRNFAGLGRQGDARPRRGLQRGRQAALCRRQPPGDRRRELWRLRGGLVDHAHRSLQGGGQPRRRVQPRIDVACDRRGLVHAVGIRRTAVERTAKEQFQKFSPHRYAANIKTPTLVITNQQDFRVPVDQGLQLFTALRLHGVPSKALVFDDEGHWVLKSRNSQYWHEQVFGWMKQYLEH